MSMLRGLWGIGCVLALASGARAAAIVEFSGLAQGTTYSIKVVGDLDASTRQELHAAIDRLLADFDAQLSTYRDDSELSRFNASRSDDWFAVSPTTATVVHRALEIAALSDGALDPTVAPLLRLWRIDRRTRSPRLPDEAALAAAREFVGYRRLHARLDPPALRKDLPELEVNLNAIAPGYSVDLIVELLRQRGIANCMVEVGGEVRTAGRKPDGSSWRIGVERPSDTERTLQIAVPIDDQAIATSGDYRQYVEIAGVRYSHTIDPATGRPVTHGLASVTVLAPDCMSADGLATALMVLGPERGLALADREGLAAWMLLREPDGTLRSLASRAFATGIGQRVIDLTATSPAATGMEHRDTPPPAGAAAAAQTSDAAAQPPVARPEPPAQAPWSTLLFTLAVFGTAMAGLGLGLLLRGKALPGSCGGLAGLRDEHGHPMCPSCTVPRDQCAEFRRRAETDAAETSQAESEAKL